MFDRFGEFNSVEELNEAAEAQKVEGDKTAFYAIASENGIEVEDADDYWNGEVDKLATVKMAAYGRLAVEERELSKESKDKKMALRVILSMTKSMCTDEEMARAVMTKGKRIAAILEAMKNEASKHKTGGMAIACGTDRQLCEIIKAYYTGSKKELQEQIRGMYE